MTENVLKSKWYLTNNHTITHVINRNVLWISSASCPMMKNVFVSKNLDNYFL